MSCVSAIKLIFRNYFSHSSKKALVSSYKFNKNYILNNYFQLKQIVLISPSNKQNKNFIYVNIDMGGLVVTLFPHSILVGLDFKDKQVNHTLVEF